MYFLLLCEARMMNVPGTETRVSSLPGLWWYPRAGGRERNPRSARQPGSWWRGCVSPPPQCNSLTTNHGKNFKSSRSCSVSGMHIRVRSLPAQAGVCRIQRAMELVRRGSIRPIRLLTALHCYIHNIHAGVSTNIDSTAKIPSIRRFIHRSHRQYTLHIFVVKLWEAFKNICLPKIFTMTPTSNQSLCQTGQ